MRSLFLAGFLLLAYAGLRQRHWLRSLFWLALGLFFSLYLKSFRHWLEGLGSDSFSEAQNFAWKEAWFFLQTLSSILRPLAWQQLLETIGLAILIAAVILTAQSYFARRLPMRAAWIRQAHWPGALCLILPLVTLTQHAHARFQSNSSIFESIQRNFSHPDPSIAIREIGPHSLRVLVYIGESTTPLNWSLYGYPRPTTPKLDALRQQDPGLLVFHQVMSTHTHTSPSLLEALSFQWADGQTLFPIYERQRLSLIDVLKQLSVPTQMFSNQAVGGTYSLAGPILFRQADRVDYSRQNAALIGDWASKLDALPDDDYFMSHAPWFDTPPGQPAVTFLHSYAGHGNYLDNIPPSFRSPVDSQLQTASLARVFGSRLDDTHLIASNAEGYDSAMRYVDHSIGRVLDTIQASRQPTVFLYFSDHGESPYTDVGHDSSRFQHEMFRVPFLMYFNAAARQADPALFQTFDQASQLAWPSALAQVPATILRLLGYRLDNAPQPFQGIGLDDPTTLPPVVVRRLAENTSVIRSHGNTRLDLAPAQAQDHTDPATTLWLNQRQQPGRSVPPPLCYDQTNTWAKAVRATAVASCLTIPIVLQQGALGVAPTSPDAAWGLDAITRLAATRSLQLDGQALPIEAACSATQDWLQTRRPDGLAPDRIALILADPEQTDPPPACQPLIDQGITLILAVPASAQTGADPFQSWRQTVAQWPQHYRLDSPPAPDLRQALARLPAAQWHLAGVPVDALPWPPADAAVPSPASLTIRTDWDANSLR